MNLKYQIMDRLEIILQQYLIQDIIEIVIEYFNDKEKTDFIKSNISEFQDIHEKMANLKNQKIFNICEIGIMLFQKIYGMDKDEIEHYDINGIIDSSCYNVIISLDYYYTAELELLYRNIAKMMVEIVFEKANEYGEFEEIELYKIKTKTELYDLVLFELNLAS